MTILVLVHGTKVWMEWRLYQGGYL